MHYDSCEKVLLGWLSNYINWSIYVQNQEAVMQDLQAEIALEAAPKTTHYSFEPGGSGWNKPSLEEAALDRKEAKQRQLNLMKVKHKKLSTRIANINRSLAALSGTDEKIVRQRGIYQKKWDAIAADVHCDESICRKRYHRAISQMACMIFGPSVGPSQINLFLGKEK